MSAILLDGKALSIKLREDILKFVNETTEKGMRKPSLSVILVGDDNASQIYVRNKKNACAAAGINSDVYLLDVNEGEKKLYSLIEHLNNDDTVDGILVQSPLPKGYDEKKVVDLIIPEKDVDAFHPLNVGKYFLGTYSDGFLPCTPAGVMKLLAAYGISPAGKKCVVVGRSNIVGKPMATLLLAENGTVSVCHSKTPSLRDETLQADIIVAAVGKAKLITGDMIKEGAVVVDVGMNRDNGKLCGDVDFDSCVEKASYITPVPGGVGPMTIAMLLENTIKAYKKNMNII